MTAALLLIAALLTCTGGAGVTAGFLWHWIAEARTARAAIRGDRLTG